MSGPVTRVYWKHYSKYYDQHDNIQEAAFSVEYGDGNGWHKTTKVVDENGKIVFNENVSDSNIFKWSDSILEDK